MFGHVARRIGGSGGGIFARTAVPAVSGASLSATRQPFFPIFAAASSRRGFAQTFSPLEDEFEKRQLGGDRRSASERYADQTKAEEEEERQREAAGAQAQSDLPAGWQVHTGYNGKQHHQHYQH